MLTLAASLAVTVLLADVPNPFAPKRPPDECSRDSDCTISTFAGCCGSCCPREPYAISLPQQRATDERCAVKECAKKPCGERECAAVTSAGDWRAVCERGQCKRVPANDGAVCRVDSDCVATDFACCPRCCGDSTRAMTRAELAQLQESCARKRCASPDCRGIDCKSPPPPSAFRALCAESRCVLVSASAPPPPPPHGLCQRDADCAIVYTGGQNDAACRSSPCGCCPGTTPVAVPASSVERQGTVPLTKSGEKPPFGLNPGGAQPSCRACPPQPPARAVCLQNQCEVESVRRTPPPPG